MSASRACFGLSAVVLGCVLSLSTSAEVLVNGGFESQPNFGAGVGGDAGFSALTGSQIPGWTIATGHAATVHNTVLYPTIAGGYSVNMDGEGFGGRNASLYQDFASAIGNVYTLRYDWQTWTFDTTPKLNVSVIDTVSASVLYTATFSALSTSAVQSVVASFAGTGNPLRLQLQEMPPSGYNDNTFIVDNFSVTAVPEAPVVAMWLAGLVAVAAARAAKQGRAR